MSYPQVPTPPLSLSRLALGLVLCAFAASCAMARPDPLLEQAPKALPIGLTNAEFWTLFEQYSEPGGDFPSDNFTSNETSVGALAGELASAGRTGGAYLGVGPEQNFTYMVALRPEVAFLVDIRRQAAIQHLMYKALFELSRSRTEFVARLFSKPVQLQFDVGSSITEMWDGYLGIASDSTLFVRNLADIRRQLLRTRGGGSALSEEDISYLIYVYGAFFRLGPTISYSGYSHEDYPSRSVPVATFVSLTTAIDSSGNPRSFLGTEESFLYIKNLQERNLIIPVVGDFAGNRALPSVARWLRAHSTPVTAFYVSNVEQYLFKPGNVYKQFYSNVERLPLTPSSLFIRPGQGAMPGGRGPHQHSGGRMQSGAMVMPPVTVDGGPISGPRLDPSAVTPQQRTPALCPIAEFLAAYRLDRVQSWADAASCVR